MGSRFEDCIEHTLEVEGGYTHDPDDSGGPTKWGITLTFYRSYVDEAGTIDDIKNLTRQDAKDIYEDCVWTPARFVTTDEDGAATHDYSDLPVGSDRLVFSYAINMGWKRGHTLLQKAIAASGEEISVDGWLGPSTVKAAHRTDSRQLVERLTVEALAFYSEIIRNDPSQKKFMRGWFYRATSELTRATEDILRLTSC